MTFTVASLVSFLAGALAASPPQPVSSTLVHRAANDRVPAIQRTERTVDIVNDGPNDHSARPLRELFGARVVLADGDSVTEGPTPSRGIGLRELLAARVEGDIITDGPTSPPPAAARAVVKVARIPASTR